jgi:hypothetical protein
MPAAKPIVTDLKTATRNALKAEATGGDLSVVYDGDSYSIPIAEEWDIGVLEAAEGGNIVTAMKLLLGPDQWAAFRATHTMVGQMKAFFQAAGEATGGNS